MEQQNILETAHQKALLSLQKANLNEFMQIKMEFEKLES